jgi:hypothetical protein
MSDASATVLPGQCAEKSAFIGQIKEVIAEILRVHSAELEAVANGDFTQKESTEGRLKELRGQKILLMERIQSNVSTHGC